jgi:alpha-N-arabinofuranosidase
MSERKRWEILWVLASAVVCLGVVAYCDEQGGTMTKPATPNGLRNGSFEEMDGTRVVGWKERKLQGEGTFAHAEAGRRGGHSVMLRSDAGGDLEWFGTFEVTPFATYRLTGFVKTENVAAKGGKGAAFNVSTTALDASRDHPSRFLTGTNDWTELEVVFETPYQDCVTVHCGLGFGGAATGTAWFDDLKLELVEAKKLSPKISIHTAETGEPISKYIYGQFIEHLGRCIYGGIWAEMLEDRKFFYPVGDKESPWRAFPEAGRVEMTKSDPFVGEHTPSIRVDGAAAGITQDGLALQKGRGYVGYIILAGEPGAGPVELAVSWGAEQNQKQVLKRVDVTGEYVKTQFDFTAREDAENATLSIAGTGKGIFRIGTLSIMPADNVKGMRKDTLALLKDLDSPVYRWPGGNFVSGYDWRDGIGDRDRRPPRKNPAWLGIEHNDFGLDEFMAFCRELKTEPYIAVNSGLGDARNAAEEAEYANGPADSPMGKLRAQNGHPDAYGVKFWSIGNEMYGDWQLGHMPLDEYVKKHNAFAEAMRAVDPAIKLIGVGATGEWSRTMLAGCAEHMDLLSEHFYCHDRPGLMSHVRQIPDNVRFKADMHRKYQREIPALANKNIPIALDEWNYWYGPEIYGQIGTRYFLKDALGIAAGLHQCFRDSDVFYMANYAQTVNVIGAIKTSKTAAAFETTGLVLKLYRQAFGCIPIEATGYGEPLDVAVAWREDRRAITIGIVNAMRDAYDVEFSIAGAALTGQGMRYIITAKDPNAYNEPGKQPTVVIEEEPVKEIENRLKAPPISVCVYVLDVE